MRLTSLQIEQIHGAIRHFLGATEYNLYLYGSRIHDHLKGGDIDLLVVTSSDGIVLFNKKILDILVEIKKQPDIGQRRIDLKAVTAEDLASHPFLKIIKDEMIQI